MGASSKESRARRRSRSPAIVPIAIGWLAGCLVEWPQDWAGVAIDGGIVVSLFALGMLALRGSVASRGAAWMLWSIAGAGAGTAHAVSIAHFAHGDDRRLRAAHEPELVSLTGWITSDPVVHSARRTTLTIESLDAPPRVHDVDASALPRRLFVGDAIRVRGWRQPDPAPRNPGQLDMAAWRARRGVVGGVSVEDPALVVPLGSVGASWHGARAVLARSLRRSLPEHAAPELVDMLVAMNLGVTGASMRPVRDLFSRTGLSHFIVISGFHLAVMAASILFVASRMGVGRRGRGVILLGASIVFLLVLESQVSVLRAGLAGSIAGAALLAGRSWPASSILAVVAIVVTAVDPADARDAAFQLSFGAVAALLEVAPTLSARLERLCDRAHWWSVRRRPDLVRRGIVHPEGLRRVALTRMAVRPIAASLAAWIVVTPITLHHFGQCALWAIPASVVLAPLASAIALVGTLAAVVAAWSIEVAAPLGWLLAMLGSVFLAAVEGVATLPGATALLPRPPAWWSLVAIALPFLIVSASKRNRRAAMALAGAWIVVALMPLLPSAGREPQIVVLDLGRARCSLVIAGRSALLVDAGDSGRSMGVGAPGSSAARSILRAAVELGVTRFDAVVVTEHSLESMGAVPDLLELASIDRLLVVESMLDSPASTVPGRMLAIAAARGVPVEPISPASSVRAGDGGASLELRFRRDDAAPPDRRLVVTAGEPSSPHGFGASTPAFESLPEHPPVPMSALRAMHDGIARHAPPRGARRWRLDPAFGWISDRFDRDRWRPSSTSE